MLHQITPSVFVSDYTEATDRPRLGYVHGTKRSLMIDAGNSADHAKEFLKELEDRGLPAPDLIGLTHWHWDHVYGLHALSALSVCTALTQAKLIEMQGWKWDEASMQERLKSGEDIPFCDEHIRVEYPDRTEIRVTTADLTFEDTLTFDLGTLTCIFRRLPNCHAEDSCVIYIPEEKILFLGDIISEDFHHGQPHYRPDCLKALIRALQSLDFTVAIHGHTEFFTKTDLLSLLETSLQGLSDKDY